MTKSAMFGKEESRGTRIMSIKFEASKDIEVKLQEIIDNLMSSKETYEFNIREEKNNDIYTNINITIRKVSG